MTPDTVPVQQYCISNRAPDQVPDGFSRASVGDWHLVVDSDFTVLPVLRGDRRHGIVFGTILQPRSNSEPDTIRLDCDSDSESVASEFENSLRELLGRFVGILDTDDGSRVYIDPIGSLPAVYDSSRQIVAASPLAIPGVTHSEQFRTELYEAIKGPLLSGGESIWLPGSDTYYRGVSRLLPNHYLDLETWESNRFWPVNQETNTDEESSEVMETIVSDLHNIFTYIEQNYSDPKLSLTAGKDSRGLVASSRPVAERGNLSLFTIGDSDWDVDVHVARRIANSHDLRWTPLPVIDSTEADKSRWLERTGYAVGSSVKESYTTMHQLDADVEIGGLGGEIGRSNLWDDSDSIETDIDPRGLLLRFQKPEHPRLISLMEEWLEEVQEFDTYTKLDLAHHEHRLGCWAGPQHLGFRPDVDHVRPYCYRPIIEAVHRLQPDFRRNDQLPLQIIERCWPELDDFPYNSFTDNKKYWISAVNNLKILKIVFTDPEFTVDYLSRKYMRR